MEAVEDQRRDVEFIIAEELDDLVRHGLRIDEFQRFFADEVLRADDAVVQLAAEIIIALAAQRVDFHGLALGFQVAREVADMAADIGVEGAGQTAIRGDGEDEMGFIPPIAHQQRRRAGIADRAGGERAHHLAHALGIGARSLRLRLRAAELGGGHHFHRARDLLRGFHAVDPVAERF